MHHPLEFIPQKSRKSLAAIFFVATLVLFGILSILDQPLRTSAAPNGIVSFELVMSPNYAREIISQWEWETIIGHNCAGKCNPPILYAAFSLGLDFLFIPIYTMTLSLGLLLAAEQRIHWMYELSAWVTWGVFAAALFDIIENYALWHLLRNYVSSPYPQIAAVCAIMKFFLLILGVVASVMIWITGNKNGQS